MARIEKTINLNVDTSDGQKNVEGLNLLTEQSNCFSNYCYPSLFLGEEVAVSRGIK